MALTRPKLSHNIDTDSSVFTDPILVLHQSATSANVDSGFLFNRANGLVSNVAIYWSESANSFVTAFTTNAGSSNSNISVSMYANLRTGILTSNSITNSGTLVIGNTGDVSANIGSFYTYANATFATVSGTSSGIDANLGAFQTYANTKIGTNNNGNLVVAALTQSTSTTTGALVVGGGAAVGGNLYVGGNLIVSNVVYQNSEIITTTELVQGNMIAASSAVSTSTTTGALVVIGGAGIGGALYITNTGDVSANIGAYQTYANANVTAIQANLGAYQTYANANVVAIQANLGAYQTFANSNAATQATSIDIINANIGAYQTYANANVVAIQANLGAYQTYANANVVAIQANLGAYQTYANANIVAIQANLGAYQTYANANVVAIQANLGAYQTYANANVVAIQANLGAYQTYANANVVAIQANLGAFQIFSNANAATQATSINNINANVGAYQIYANANLGTATTNITTLFSNAASQEISITSLATGANANTAAYLPSVTTLAGLTSFGATNTTTTAQGNLIVVGNLTVQGNTLTIGSNNLTVTDSIIDLHTFANLDPLISNDGRDIGIRFHYYKTSDKHAFLGWENATETLTYYQDATETNGTVTGTLGNVELGSLYISNTATSTSTTTGALQVRGGVGISGNVVADKLYTTNGLFWSGNGSAFSSGLTISEINSANALSNISNSVTSIRFDRDTGFSVVELDPGNVKVSLGSSFKTWHVPGQADLVAVAEDEVTFFGNSIDITTNPTAPKSITFATNLAAYTGNITAGNITSSGNIRTDKLYTTSGLFWSGNGVSINVSTLNDLSDVVIDTPSSNQVLKYDGVKWVNGAAPGGGGGGSGITYTAGVAPPVSANVADQWYDTVNDVLYEYLDDGTTDYWVDIQSQGQVGNIISVSDATLSGNIVVGVNNRYSIGASGGYLKNIYANTIVGNITTISNANITTLGVDTTTTRVLNVTTANITTGNVQTWYATQLNSTTGNITTLTSTTVNAGSLIVTSGDITPTSNLTQNIGSVTNWWNTIYGVSTQARYADLAERYRADAEYPSGTVVVFGGEYEITVSTKEYDPAVAGVISSDPAYLMNAAAEGLPVALQGRVPCQVQGPIRKGELVVSSNVPGVAQRFIKEQFEHGCIIGKSLENINDDTIKTIEVVVGRY